MIMDESPNFLLGYGERLTEPVDIPSTFREKFPPYKLTEARTRFLPKITSTVSDLDKLPGSACPQDEAVANIMLHPEYLAKSYYPTKLFTGVNLRVVGSRSRFITPEKRSRDRAPTEAPTIEYYVASKREAFHVWSDELPQWTQQDIRFSELARLEDIYAQPSPDKVKQIQTDEDELIFEIVLHARELRSDNYILKGFQGHLEDLQIQPDFERRFFAGGLCFLRIKAPRNEITRVAQFSFLRVAREMPRLRSFRPVTRGHSHAPQPAELPTEKPLDPSLRVAVFDGGIREASPLDRWVHAIEGSEIGSPTDEATWHGEAVSSSLLFGSITNAGNVAIPIPYAEVDHYRVLDSRSESDPFELYEVLERIKDVIESINYQFLNFSIGPASPLMTTKFMHGPQFLMNFFPTETLSLP